ncbi:MAG: hypothetical protein ACYC92_11940 [Candidatus Acidiferrales bacterium]
MTEKMKPEPVRLFIKLMRAYCHLRADRNTLAAILQTAETLNQVPHGWLNALKLARTTPEYRSISEQLEPSFGALEESLEESELARLIESIPSTDLPN